MDNENSYNIKLINNFGKKWFSGSNYRIKGYAFLNGSLLTGETFAKIIYSNIEDGTLEKLLKILNGNFVGVFIVREVVYLVADKLRSYPLLFTNTQDHQWIITDSESVVLDENRIDKSIDFIGEQELLGLGYISGNNTIFKNVKALGAGEYIVLNSDNKYKVYRYYEYIIDKDEFNENNVISHAYLALEAAFKRTIATLPKNTQIVIPLSGGYDSRLIACLCKKYKLDNVICYTYGDPESFEVKTSHQVAMTLDLEWHYVKYDSAQLVELLNSKKGEEYYHFASNCNAIPHIQDFFAIKTLTDKGIINKGAVVIPGFCGDLFGGSKVPREIFKTRPRKISNTFLDKLLYEHFYDLNNLNKSSRKLILKKLKADSSSFDVCSIESFCNHYEQWCIYNRISKFIINSLRVYEFFGLDWRMPLWDDQYADVWYRVPWEDKVPKLLNKFMFEYYFKPLKVDYYKKQLYSQQNVVTKLIKKMIPGHLRGELIKIMLTIKGEKVDINCFVATANKLYSKIGSFHIKGVKKWNTNRIGAVLAKLKVKEYRSCMKRLN